MAWIQSTAPTTLKRTRDGHLKPTDLILKQEQELKLLIEPFTTTLCFGLSKEYLPQQISSAQLSKLFIRKANIHTSMLLAYRVLTRTFMLASAIWDRYIQEVDRHSRPAPRDEPPPPPPASGGCCILM